MDFLSILACESIPFAIFLTEDGIELLMPSGETFGLKTVPEVSDFMPIFNGEEDIFGEMETFGDGAVDLVRFPDVLGEEMLFEVKL